MYSKKEFDLLLEFARQGATLVEIWTRILQSTPLQYFWKEQFGYQETDFRVWRFLVMPKRCHYLEEFQYILEKEPLQIHWRDLLDLYPSSIQNSISYLSEAHKNENYYDRLFRKPVST